jgi:predicted alpha/beta superfamily hydrolase
MSERNTAYHAHEVEDHVLRSAVVDQAFRIKVLQPMSRVDDSERFPVLYMTDSDEFFGAIATVATALQDAGETPRFILVGIGYENARAAVLLRSRDLYLHAIRERLQQMLEQLAHSPMAGADHDLRSITQTTDATEFLEFIRGELMPFINSRYPVLPNDDTFCGYSAGGAFGLYTLFTHPGTFRRYILGSPVTCHSGYDFGIELAESFIRSGRSLNAKVFMSVGELEHFDRGLDPFELVTGYYRLAKFLKQAAIPGLELTLRLFPGETHASAWTAAFIHGSKTLFGAVDRVPYWPAFIK